MERIAESVRLEPQDVVIALKLVAGESAAWSPSTLATALHMSEDEITAGLERLEHCQLYASRSRRVIRRNLAEFLVAGLRYVFPGRLGDVGDGMPTSTLGAPTLSARFLIGDDDCDQQRNVVWLVEGDAARARGRILTPLYRNVPLAAAKDPALHEYLALVDALRVGRARERELARHELERRLST